MYEEKSELSRPAPTLDEISVRLSDAVNIILMKSVSVFLKNFRFR